MNHPFYFINCTGQITINYQTIYFRRLIIFPTFNTMNNSSFTDNWNISSSLSITSSSPTTFIHHVRKAQKYTHMTMYFRRPIIFLTMHTFQLLIILQYLNIYSILISLTKFIYHAQTAQTYAHSFAVYILIDLIRSILCPCPT